MNAISPLVEMLGIVKAYGKVRALNGVDFMVGKGEIVTLLGDNGAGKSTLIKILSGAEHPTDGGIRFNGKPVKFRSTRDAISVGIETIYQDSALVEQLSIGRNLFLGREPTRRFGPARSLDAVKMDRVTRDLLARVGISKNMNPKTPITALSGGERQAIAIARAMYFDADLIVLDEPTNNLGVEETLGVLRFIREARDAGRSCVFITHNMHHALQVADRAVVLRLGQKVADLERTELSMERIERIIMGLEDGNSALQLGGS
jgi:simple sugar transport system ATP-binding protein